MTAELTRLEEMLRKGVVTEWLRVHKGSIDSIAAVDGLVLAAQHLLPAETLDAVRGDDDVADDLLAALEDGARLVLVVVDDPAAQADLRPAADGLVEEDGVQVAAVADDARVAVHRLGLALGRVAREDGRVPVVHDRLRGVAGDGVEAVEDAPPPEQPRDVGAEADAVADGEQLRRLLEDRDGHALLAAGDGGGQAAEACADDEDV